MPERIQLRRTRGYRKPEGAVVVSRPTRWGNPWSVKDGYSRETAVAFFAEYLEVRRDPQVSDGVGYPSDEEICRELGGRSLACWCPLPAPGEPDVCHAAVLLDMCNPAMAATREDHTHA